MTKTPSAAALQALPRCSAEDLSALRRHVSRTLAGAGGSRFAAAEGSVPVHLDAALCALLVPDGPVPPDAEASSLVAEAIGTDGASAASTCGYIFKTGDIAWVCRTCQTDDTCVLCQDCFANSNHEGHEVFFHRTRAGGCCDCGDLEAWKAEGCCPKHRGTAASQECQPCGMPATVAEGRCTLLSAWHMQTWLHL